MPGKQAPLPRVLHVDADFSGTEGRATLEFVNEGSVAAVFHVYDRQHLDRIPRRYTVEAGKHQPAEWQAGPLLKTPEQTRLASCIGGL